MGRLIFIPIISLILLVIVYSLFGWDIASQSMAWSQLLLEQTESWKTGLQEENLIWGIHLLALSSIVITSLALTAPIALMTFFVGSCVKSEIQSAVSILIWSFIFVLVLRWFNFFVDFLVLISAAILGRLELRSMGLNRPVALALLTIICLASFSSGAYSYFHWNKYI
ncbi:MAG: hypothetical protein ACRC6M_06865 [Microcystaceae cyanobacterium]